MRWEPIETFYGRRSDKTGKFLIYSPSGGYQIANYVFTGHGEWQSGEHKFADDEPPNLGPAPTHWAELEPPE